MPVKPVDLRGSKILITGPTGQVARPVVEHYAKIADVHALARFRNAEDLQAMASLGATPVKADLAEPDTVAAIDDDFDYVLNFAVVKTGDFDYDLAANAEGVGYLMNRCRRAKAFLHFSSTAVYQYRGTGPAPGGRPPGGQSPRHVPDLQYLQDRRRIRVPLRRALAGYPDHHRQAQRSLRR